MGYSFGGELYKVNVFDKELEASEVKEMAAGGLCSQVEEKYGRSRYLKWEDLLLEEKSGNVTEIDVGCHPEEKKNDEEEGNNSTEECDCDPRNGTSFSRWDLLRGEKFYNKTVTKGLVEELKKGWSILGKPSYSNLLNLFLLSFKMCLRSDYHVKSCLFYRFGYLYDAYFSSIIPFSGDFEGATITERFISHFKFFHDGKTCGDD